MWIFECALVRFRDSKALVPREEEQSATRVLDVLALLRFSDPLEVDVVQPLEKLGESCLAAALYVELPTSVGLITFPLPRPPHVYVTGVYRAERSIVGMPEPLHQLQQLRWGCVGPHAPGLEPVRALGQ